MKKYLFGILLLSACSAEKEETVEVQTLEVSTPIAIDTTIQQEFVADIHAVQNVEIRARVKGYLDRILVDEGKQVRKGQIMFTINSQEYVADLAQAKAVLSQASAELKAEELTLVNTRLLVDKNVISKNQLAISLAKVDGLKAKREEATAHVRSAELKVENSNIRAPFDGIVDRLPFKRGSLVDEGTLLTTLSDNQNVYAYFNVSEKEYLAFSEQGGVNKSATVGLVLANGEAYPQKGLVETIEGEFDKNTGNIAFRARFLNPDKLLRHGASGKVQLPKKVSGYWAIPQKSVFEIQEKSYVFVKDPSGAVKMKSIIPDLRIPHFYLVKSGFSEKDTVLIEGIQLVKQGQKIKSTFKPMRELLTEYKAL
ncbi:efflux RND transporter periplasmic adaptor subunit [Aquirufa sp.]|jgi:membrane fusion protein (multidrug efflux system)|uniref:efflux RND transporter periplasmic adaptor subunit n=1 Tax=Aquirufa sp. TaxID=2676249 RepID=UPI0037BF5281